LLFFYFFPASVAGSQRSALSKTVPGEEAMSLGFSKPPLSIAELSPDARNSLFVNGPVTSSFLET